MIDSTSVQLVDELRGYTTETEWLEFKLNHLDPERIGKCLSALANGAAIKKRPHGYLLFGVDDATHQVRGTTFNPYVEKEGNQSLLIWLSNNLKTNGGDLEYFRVDHPQGAVALFQIDAACHSPVQFKNQSFIRIGDSTTELSRHPSKERVLWGIFNETPFDSGIAATNQDDDSVRALLDCETYFRLLKCPVPETSAGILSQLSAEKLIVPKGSQQWDITNLGAILFAKGLSNFPRLQRKGPRVIQYPGHDRDNALRDQSGVKGYATGFEGLLGYVGGLLPNYESIDKAFRRSEKMFPYVAVRELVANALMHQDFTVIGASPTIEVYNDRIEITNPGNPLVDPRRLLDAPPQSRNDALCALLRRCGICEERGGGIDKAVEAIEKYRLPAPLFESTCGFTRVVLFATRSQKNMDKSARLRSIYLHACLKFVRHDSLTNPSLRERFGLERTESNVVSVSRYIKEAVDAGLIKPRLENSSRSSMQYIPFWA